MFRKLHIQMTLFSALATGGILIVMTVVCLFISESLTRENSYTSFSNNAQSCILYLSDQSLLSHKWLLQIQSTYDVEIELRDNNNPLFFDKLNPAVDSADPFEEAKMISRDTYGLDLEDLSNPPSITQTEFFRMKGYYACTALIPRSGGVLSAVILQPLKELEKQIFSQRIFFAVTVLAAIFALILFSWFFTKKMISPLREGRKKQTEFIASASHELRSPLAVIQSSASAMEGAPYEEIQHFTEIIQKESRRMTRLINDMLSLANADNHSWNLLKSPCELDTLLLDVYEKYEPLAKAKKLQLQILLPETPLPFCTCDASRISQVLAILLDNAVSYVPAGGRISLSLCREEDGFHLSVADNGPGIPDDMKEAVFQRFYRADTSRNDKQHFGLGLCIAKEIILLHNGTIQILNTPGGGSTFLLILPA